MISKGINARNNSFNTNTNYQASSDSINTNVANSGQTINQVTHNLTPVEEMNFDSISIQDQMTQAGYEYYLTGTLPENVEWNVELQHYFEQGIEQARQSGILFNQWQQDGYSFITTGDINYEYCERDPGAQTEAYQQGIIQALREGKVANPNDIHVPDLPFNQLNPNDQVRATYKIMLEEGWVELGRNSVDNISILTERNLSSSHDQFFQERGIPISASNLINAGRFQVMSTRNNNTE